MHDRIFHGHKRSIGVEAGKEKLCPGTHFIPKVALSQPAHAAIT
jgi:hypothetical protein